MKLSLIILTIFFAVTFASQRSIIDSSSITNNLSELLYNRLSPIFEDTLQQLNDLVLEFSGKLSELVNDELSRLDGVKPADWVSQLFNETNPIGAQWNSHITDFFANIPTAYETDDRSLFNFPLIKTNLHIAVENLLIELEELFDNTINQLLTLFTNKLNSLKSIDHELKILSKIVKLKASSVFDNTEEKLDQTIDDLMDSIIAYWNNLKDRVFG